MPYQVVARNIATQSENRIHSDEVARVYGFAGGLVPGVDVYAYMTHLPVERWGLAWLERGTMQARFLQPVYDGDTVTVLAQRGLDPEELELELRNGADEVCATGRAALPAEPGPGAAGQLPDLVVAIDERPDASPESLPAGRALGLPPRRFLADRAGEYLEAIGEDLAVYSGTAGTDAVAHPGWLLRLANYVLSSNVRLGPWIHVESVTTHHGLVRDGQPVDARATVTREWEHRGHRFVELDVALVADGDRQVAHITHTAIYRPRPRD